jgi:hypothetical protein
VTPMPYYIRAQIMPLFRAPTGRAAAQRVGRWEVRGPYETRDEAQREADRQTHAAAGLRRWQALEAASADAARTLPAAGDA